VVQKKFNNARHLCFQRWGVTAWLSDVGDRLILQYSDYPPDE
jgi:hypothetical protein